MLYVLGENDLRPGFRLLDGGGRSGSVSDWKPNRFVRRLTALAKQKN
jgi:hypothetical protein